MFDFKGDSTKPGFLDYGELLACEPMVQFFKRKGAKQGLGNLPTFQNTHLSVSLWAIQHPKPNPDMVARPSACRAPPKPPPAVRAPGATPAASRCAGPPHRLRESCKKQLAGLALCEMQREEAHCLNALPLKHSTFQLNLTKQVRTSQQQTPKKGQLCFGLPEKEPTICRQGPWLRQVAEADKKHSTIKSCFGSLEERPGGWISCWPLGDLGSGI